MAEGAADVAVRVRLGDASKAIGPMREAGVEELVLAGAINRPSLAELRPNLRVAGFLAKVGKRAFGDDGLLSAIIGALEEEEGFRVIGIDDLVGDLVATLGLYGRHAPDRRERGAGADGRFARRRLVVRRLRVGNEPRPDGARRTDHVQ